jgi:hypothetical protein
MTDEEKNKFDAFSVFWKQAWDNISERRKYEIRMTFAVWAALAALITALLIQNVRLRVPSENLLLFSLKIPVIVLFCICAAHLYYLKGVGERHNLDRKLARIILRSISDIKSLDFPYGAYINTLPKLTNCWLDWSRWVQIVVTVVLAAVAVACIYARLNYSDEPQSLLEYLGCAMFVTMKPTCG